jgi:hypothetical protein
VQRPKFPNLENVMENKKILKNPKTMKTLCFHGTQIFSRKQYVSEEYLEPGILNVFQHGIHPGKP